MGGGGGVSRLFISRAVVAPAEITHDTCMGGRRGVFGGLVGPDRGGSGFIDGGVGGGGYYADIGGMASGFARHCGETADAAPLDGHRHGHRGDGSPVVGTVGRWGGRGVDWTGDGGGAAPIRPHELRQWSVDRRTYLAGTIRSAGWGCSGGDRQDAVSRIWRSEEDGSLVERPLAEEDIVG